MMMPIRVMPRLFPGNVRRCGPRPFSPRHHPSGVPGRRGSPTTTARSTGRATSPYRIPSQLGYVGPVSSPPSLDDVLARLRTTAPDGQPVDREPADREPVDREPVDRGAVSPGAAGESGRRRRRRAVAGTLALLVLLL